MKNKEVLDTRLWNVVMRKCGKGEVRRMEYQKKDLIKDIRLSLFLVLIFFVLLYITIPNGVVYGSQTDWLSQHVSLAETLRDEMLDKETLFPNFIWLGGGSNAYNFSYYGYLRPDIVIGCLLPEVSMEHILVVAMIVSFLATVLLCYCWLRMKKLRPGPSFLGSFFCMTAACFFHFHRQIMFINYMPLLFLALILTERTIKKRKLLLYCTVLSGICFQSYYYAIACFIVICIYWWQTTKEWRDWLFLLKMLVLSVGSACVLLVPTFLALLENKRASGGTDITALLTPQLQITGLLYSPYGIGFSMIMLYLLLTGLLHRRYRAGSIGSLCLFCFPIIPYMLNGTLYARPKILIPFLPLILLHCMKIMQGIWKEQIKPSSRLAFGVLLIAFSGLLMAENGRVTAALLLVMCDMLFILLFSWMWKWKNKAVIYLILLIAPLAVTIILSGEEDYVSEKKISEDTFTECELKMIAREEWARTDYMKQPLTYVNQIQYSAQKTTGMYSSVTNKRYAAFYHDIMRTPIRINNRVALLPEVNPFLQYRMSVRYIVTDAGKIPYGYKTVLERDGAVIAENQDVLPMAYLSTKTISAQQFRSLKFPYTLEALLKYTVIEENDKSASSQNTLPLSTQAQMNRSTKMEKKEFLFSMPECPKGITWKRQTDGVGITASAQSECTLQLKESLKDKIGILSFDVENETGKAVVITMNGIRNKLSGAGAPYPNENKRFTFYLDEDMNQELKIQCSEGKFRICNVAYYVFPRNCLVKKDMRRVSFQKAKQSEVLHCQTKAALDSYFVTSVPYQEGMELLVDGRLTKAELVDTAFLGVRLEAGTHDVRVVFIPPGKRSGMMMTAVSMILIIMSEMRWYYRNIYEESSSYIENKNF